MKLKVMSHIAIAALLLAAFFALALFMPPIGVTAKEAGMVKERALLIITFFAAVFLVVIGSVQDTRIIRRINSMISLACKSNDKEMLNLFEKMKSHFRKGDVIRAVWQSIILMLIMLNLFVLNVKSALFTAFLFFLILFLYVFSAVQDSHIKSEFKRMDEELDKEMMAALEKIPGCSRN